MRNYLSKITITSFILLVALYGFGGQDPKVKTVSFGNAKPLGDILNPDGTVRLEKGLSGSFDPRGFQMITETGKPPRFVPAEKPLPQSVATDGVKAAAEGEWDSRFTIVGASDTVNCCLVVDGTLYAGGTFTCIGDVLANRIAKWDGTSWSALGSGMDSEVEALAFIGTDLYAGGWFWMAGGIPASRIAKWNGTNWSALGLGTDGVVNSLAVMGTDLYAGGIFSNAGGVTARNIARWNGTTWSALGLGIDGVVNSLAVMGTDLYAGGSFSNAGGVTATNIAKWNGTTWSALGSGMIGDVKALAVSGSDLYAGGWFSTAGGVTATNIAKWNGTTWSALGSGMNNHVYALAIIDTDLYAGGYFSTAGGGPANHIAKWNGTTWSSLGSGTDSFVSAIAVSGSGIYAGGSFSTAGEVQVNYIAKWNAGAWSPMGDTMGLGMNSIVHALAVSDTDLYAGGSFSSAGGIVANNIAKWDGTTWSALGLGINGDVYTLAVVGTDLYAGGWFYTAGGVSASHIAKWDGTTWSALGGWTSGTVHALAVMGTDLYAGGWFSTAGGVVTSNIAKWNGTTWSALGSGTNGSVRALAIIGTDLYAGGWFSTAGGVAVNRIAKWDGTTWSALGSGMNGSVYAMAVIDSDLYAGGEFSSAGGVSANYIAKWDGTIWSALGSGVINAGVYSLAVMGTDLYAGGYFTKAGGMSANRIAKWDGTSWSTLGSGFNDYVHALAFMGTALCAGGNFTTAGGKVSGHFGIWHPTIIIPAPEINLKQGETDIASDGTYGFGSRTIDTDTDTIFTIENTGNSQLTLSGIPLAVSGADANQFSITVQPASPIAPAGNTAFTVRFRPTTAGAKTALISIANDDGNENPFILNLTGTGIVGQPAIALSRTSINFGAERNGVVTPPETSIVTNSGLGTLSWSAISSAGWLSVTPGSGTGSGVLTIGIADTTLEAGTYQGTVTVSDPAAANSPLQITVSYTVFEPGEDAFPFGQFDTPLDGATVASSIAVSGWALDETGMQSVKIYRGTDLSDRIFVGDAMFVEGARPDVAGAYPNYPQNTKAGWGYMLLTNFLPNGGNGTFTLLAYATDLNGREVLLGQKTITCDNANAVLPFGAIDTPTQGGTASGSGYFNFGWALTPMPNSIPTNGSTIIVWLDGVPLGHPTYNYYRADIATLFPGYANSNGAVGLYTLNTTAYTNAVHTIAWSVQDSGGNVDGVGSRYFLIQNIAGGSSSNFSLAAGEERQGGIPRTVDDISRMPDDPLRPVFVRLGRSANARTDVILPETDSSVRIKIPEVTRVAIYLNEKDAGETLEGLIERGSRVLDKTVTDIPRFEVYELALGQLRPLPIGAAFDSRDGVFFWQPGPGFLGEYAFVIIDRSTNTCKTIKIHILPK